MVAAGLLAVLAGPGGAAAKQQHLRAADDGGEAFVAANASTVAALATGPGDESSMGGMFVAGADNDTALPLESMEQQLSVLREYLNKLTVKHELMLEKYRQLMQNSDANYLRRLVAGIVTEELDRRAHEREEVVGEIVEKVVNILRRELNINAPAATEEEEEAQVQEEAIQEAVAELTGKRSGSGAAGDAEGTEEEEEEEEAAPQEKGRRGRRGQRARRGKQESGPRGGTDRVLDDVLGDEEGEEAEPQDDNFVSKPEEQL